MNTPEEAILVLQAFAAGKPLQVRSRGENWVDRVLAVADKMPNFTDWEYRIKPVPVVKWYITYDITNSKNAYTWLASSEQELNQKIREITERAHRKIAFIVKEEDGVRTLLPQPAA